MSHYHNQQEKKTGYNMTLIRKKKTKVEGWVRDEIRDRYKYEMTIAFEVAENDKHLVLKDRTGLFTDHPEFIITPEIGRRWLHGVLRSFGCSRAISTMMN
jgi:hypothetical protein